MGGAVNLGARQRQPKNGSVAMRKKDEGAVSSFPKINQSQAILAIKELVMELNRKRARIVVDISVTLTTVLDSLEARIIDLSEHGAQIVGASVPRHEKFQIEYMGQTVYAQCMWSEVDRMGVRFPFVMSDGPLYDALMMAIPSERRPTSSSHESYGGTADMMPPAASLGGLSSRRIVPSFGRRNAS
jgi:hypothetical protein